MLEALIRVGKVLPSATLRFKVLFFAGYKVRSREVGESPCD
jgi:hypothetical protein